MKHNLRLIIGLIVLLGIAGTFTLYLSWPLITGKTVVLATHPIDPFDILMGQYININYDISNIPTIENAKEGSEVYVVITEDNDNLWKYREASLAIPKDQTFIRGKIKSIYDNQMRIEYGIEQYFFERNAQLPRSNLTVEIKISNSGQARISKLLHNGKPVEIEYQNVSIIS